MLATMWLTLLALICVINNVNVATAREELESKIEIKLCDGKDGGECKGELVAADNEEKALEQLKSKHGETVKKWFSVEAKDGAEPPHCGGAQITVFSNLDLLALCKTVCDKALEQITNACPDVYLLLGNNKQTETEKQEETQEQPADTVAPVDNPDGQVTETVDTSQSQGDIDAADGTANATATADAAAELDTTLPADGETQDDPANTTATAAAVPPKADAATRDAAAKSQEDSSEEKTVEHKETQTNSTTAQNEDGMDKR